MGGLTTHVLDTASGKPAAGLRIEVLRGSRVLATAITNAAGRTDAALLDMTLIKRGHYEIVFHVADYFRNAGMALPEPPFFDLVSVRIGVAEPDRGYHVPLLVSPWSYTTYRGG